MKIVSSHKDFYDFLNGVDTDTTNVYVRKTDYRRLTEVEFKGSGLHDFIDLNCYRTYHSWYTSKYMMCSYILGIYPNVYVLNTVISPLINFDITRAEYSPAYSDGQTGFVIPNSLLPNIDLINTMYGTNLEYSPFTKGNNGLSFRHYGKVSKDCANKYVEKPDFFKMMGCPIFFGPIYGCANFEGKTYISTFIANPNLCELNKKLNGLLNIVRELDPSLDNTIYDRIENYLYSSKVEPVSEPDNKTKIVNAGFDLKTSFRNVK